LYGGFGFTWDSDIHFYFKRMLYSRATLGDSAHHRRHIAARLFGSLV
jgi:alkylation response protein AidB-like acyl-CoA dehydrogenase